MIDLSSFSEFLAPSWAAWRTRLLDRITPETREVWAVAGRGAGKSRVASLLSAIWAARTWSHAPGERLFVALVAPDRAQARTTLRYVEALLGDLVESSKADSLELANDVTVEVVTGTIAAPRGRSYCCVVLEEASFLPQDLSANPDVDILRALRPGLARVPGSLLVVIGSPYAKRGILFDAWEKYAETGGTERVLFVTGDTASFNPTFDAEAISQAYQDDPEMAAVEYGANWLSDISNPFSLAAVRAVTDQGVAERPPMGLRYVAFVDPSGGASDSFTLAIAHTEVLENGTPVRVLDCVREVKPPFSPEAVVNEMAAVLSTYGVSTVTGDRFSGEFVRELFRKAGVLYLVSSRSATQIYSEGLALVNSHRVVLLDHPVVTRQLLSLERRTSKGGQAIISHPPNSHDDAANAAMGALLLAHGQAQLVIRDGKKHGIDSTGLEWREGQPWNGVSCEHTDRDPKGRTLTPGAPVYRDGKVVAYDPIALEASDKKKAEGKKRRGFPYVLYGTIYG